jgi:hypothetical protein
VSGMYVCYIFYVTNISKNPINVDGTIMNSSRSSHSILLFYTADFVVEGT